MSEIATLFPLRSMSFFHLSKKKTFFFPSLTRLSPLFFDKTSRFPAFSLRHLRQQNMGFLSTLVEVVCAILLPPLAVFLVAGIGLTFFVNLLLTLLGWIPGALRGRRGKKKVGTSSFFLSFFLSAHRPTRKDPSTLSTRNNRLDTRAVGDFCEQGHLRRAKR